MPRNDQISRQWKIIQLLESHKYGMSVPEIARELACHVRTIYRDVEGICFAGFPIFDEKIGGVQKWKLLQNRARGESIPFQTTELIALFIASDHLKAFEDTIFACSLKSALDKIRSTLKPETHVFLAGLAQSFRVGIGGKRDYHKHSETIELVNKAVIDRNSIDIWYKDDAAKRRLDPYHVWFMGGTIYIVAYCHTRKAVRLFVLDRIRKAKLTDAKFTVPTDFSMDKFASDRFRVSGGDGLTTVRIKFNKDLAGYIKEWTWHPSQVIEDEKGGSIILSMDVEGLLEVKGWVLSFGDRAKVLEPKKLALDILKDIKSMTKLYS